MKKILFIIAALFVVGAIESSAQVIAPARKIIVKGSGGYIECPGADKYCPTAGNGTCVIITVNDDGSKVISIYGKGGIVQTDCGFHYCPDPSAELCATIELAAARTAAQAGKVPSAIATEITVYNADGTEMHINRDGVVKALPGGTVVHQDLE